MDYKHVCSLDYEKSSHGADNRIIVWNISAKNPQTKFYFRSIGSIEKERRRHRDSKYSHIIHPLSMFRFVWEAVYVLIIFTSLIVVPVNLYFGINVNNNWNQSIVQWVETAFDFLWILNIFVTFFTGVCIPRTMEVLMNPREITLRYVSTLEFYVDCIIGFPQQILVSIIMYAFPNAQWTATNIAMEQYSTLKILRIIKFMKYYNRTMEYFEYFYVRVILKYMIFVVLGIHWTVCIYANALLLPYNSYDDVDIIISSLQMYHIGNDDFETVYFESLYNTVSYLLGISLVTHFKTSKYSVSSDPPVLILFIISAVAGFISCIVLKILIIQMIMTINASQTKYYAIISQLNRYILNKDIPDNIRDRMLTYYAYRYRQRYFRDNQIMDMLSESLRRDIFLHSCRTLIDTVSVLKELPIEIITNIVGNLHHEMFLYNDIIVKAGSIGDCMYFIANGTVAVCTPTGKEICHLQDGAYFGEIALIAKDHRRVANVVAIEICEIYRLERKQFSLCFPPNSPHYKKIEQIATERIDKTLLLEELHRKYILDKTMHKRIT